MSERDLGSRKITRRNLLKAAVLGGGAAAAYFYTREAPSTEAPTPTVDFSKVGKGLEYGAHADAEVINNAADTARRATPFIHGGEHTATATKNAPVFLSPPTPELPQPTVKATTEPTVIVQFPPTATPTEVMPTATPIPVETPKPKERLALPAEQKGAAVLAFGSDPNWLKESPKLLDRLATMNVNAITLNFPIFMDGWNGTNVYRDTEIVDPKSNTQNGTPTNEFLEQFIGQAKERNMNVMFRPIIDERNINPSNKWRGNIAPKNVNTWFANYTKVMVEYASFAQAHELGGMCIGAELESMEPYGAQWLGMIDQIRSVYEGQLTYAYNHAKDGYNPKRLEMAKGLDFVGIDAFFPLDAKAGATVDQVVEAWQPRIQVLQDVKAATGKEIIFAEYGAPARDTVFEKPYDDNSDVAVNDAAQETYFKALYAKNGPWNVIKGGYIWGFGPWDVRDVPDETQANSQYNIFAKPAEAVIREAYSK